MLAGQRYTFLSTAKPYWKGRGLENTWIDLANRRYICWPMLDGIFFFNAVNFAIRIGIEMKA
jgi:hypothetical protein